MSRGYGNTQRRILAYLDKEGAASTFELAEAAYDVRPDKTGKIWLTDSQLSAVRRALKQLAKSGLVEEYARTPGMGRGIWQFARKQCECHHPVSESAK